jgi:hypothetical protein
MEMLGPLALAMERARTTSTGYISPAVTAHAAEIGARVSNVDVFATGLVDISLKEAREYENVDKEYSGDKHGFELLTCSAI